MPRSSEHGWGAQRCPSPKACPSRLASVRAHIGLKRGRLGAVVGRQGCRHPRAICHATDGGGGSALRRKVELSTARVGSGESHPVGVGLRRLPSVSMMQATNFGSRHDRAHLGALDGAQVGRVFLEREVSSRPVVVRKVAGQGAAQVLFAEDEDVSQTLIPD